MGIMASPQKHPKTGVYYFRMAVPKSLTSIIGKSEFKTSLRTKDLKEAKLRFGSYLEGAHKQIELAKLKLSGEADVEINQRDCAIIAERWYEYVKAAVESSGDYQSVLQHIQTAEGHVHEFGLSDTLSISGSEINSATKEQLQELANDLKEEITEQLDREHLVVSPESDSFRRLAVAFYDYIHRIESLCRARHKRDFGYEPITNPIADKQLSVAPVASQTSQQCSRVENSISSLFERYRTSAEVNEKDAKTLNETALQVTRLVEVIGDIDVSEVKRSHFVSYRDTALQLPKSKANSVRKKPLSEQIQMAKDQGLPTLSATSVRKSVRLLSVVFSYAVELDLIGVNPVFGVKVNTAKKLTEVEEDKGYTPEDLSRLFQTPLFKDKETPKPYGMACYWVPLLCRYTGARLNEMAQLRNTDIAVSDKGIHYINVRRGKDQSVKNNTSLRHIPIHFHLIELGFLEYVETMNDLLFPELKANKYGSKSDVISKWWSQQVKKAGVVTSQPSHSFRHSLKTAMRSVGVPDSVSDSVTGHAAKNVGDSYGTTDLQTKKDVMDQLPRLELTRLTGTS